MRLVFDGEIAGLGTAEGTRIVIGRWSRSAFGPFADAMVERPDGHRLLLAPSAPVAEFVGATYVFDEVQVRDVDVVTAARRWRVSAGDLDLEFDVGARTPLGWLLRTVPRAVVANPGWAAVLDPVARLVMPGVRTRGGAGNAGREWYGARDVHGIDDATAHWQGKPLGELRPVRPAVRFGFGSTPVRPCVVRVVSTVALT